MDISMEEFLVSPYEEFKIIFHIVKAILSFFSSCSWIQNGLHVENFISDRYELQISLFDKKRVKLKSETLWHETFMKQGQMQGIHRKGA